jgi:hypothetical protein
MKQTSLHSFLSAITLAVLTWVGYQTVQNGKSITTLTQAMVNVERKLDDTIPRREIDPRVSQLESELKQFASRLRDLELQAKLTKHP